MPARVTAGAFILNSGVSKLSADEQTAAGLHQMATGAYPFLATMKPQDFTRLLGAGEIAVGSALLLLGIGVSLLLSDLVDRFSARTANQGPGRLTTSGPA